METKRVSPIVDVIMLLIACTTSLILIKIPAVISFKELEYDFYLKNAAIIVFFGSTNAIGRRFS